MIGEIPRKGLAFTGKSETQMPATFTIFVVSPNESVQVGEEFVVSEKDMKCIYTGDESLGDTLFGVANANIAMESGLDVMLVTNPDDEVALPENWGWSDFED